MKAKNLFGKAAITLALVLCATLAIVGCNPKPPEEKLGSYYPGTLTSALPNYVYAPMVFTATSQTKTQALNGVGSATVQLSGPATVVTIQIKASNDGGTNYYAIPYTTGNTITATYLQPTIVTGGAWSYSGTPTLYYVDLSGFTNYEFVTSSTFTGASMTATVVASSNKGIF